MRENVRRYALGILALAFALSACGGGTGLGPGEIRKREDKLKDRLTIDWNQYNQGQYEDSIEAFSQTLQQADVIEGVEAVRNQVKAEAHSGIGWTLLRMQDLEDAAQSFGLATQLDRANADAWVGWAGAALAQGRYSDVVQYANQALEVDTDYNSGTRLDSEGRVLAHDYVDERHVRLMLAEAYFQLGRYSPLDRPDPLNATAQLRLIRPSYKYKDPGQLLQAISEVAIELQESITAGD